MSDYREIRKSLNRLISVLFIFIGIVSGLELLITAILSALGVMGMSKDTAETAKSLATFVSYLVSYFLSVLIYKNINKDAYAPRLNAKVGRYPIAYLFSTLGILFSASYMNSIFRFIGGAGGGAPSYVSEYSAKNIVIAFFGTAIVPAFCEELFFRGMIMTNLLKHGRGFAIITSGIIFGLAHGNHDQIFFATVSGIVFGWLYYKTGSLWLCILAHLMNNGIAVVETAVVSNFENETAFKICSMLEVAVFSLGAISIIYLLARVKKDREAERFEGFFGSVTESLVTPGPQYTFAEYVKGLFGVATCFFIGYVALSEILYVFYT